MIKAVHAVVHQNLKPAQALKLYYALRAKAGKAKAHA